MHIASYKTAPSTSHWEYELKSSLSPHSKQSEKNIVDKGKGKYMDASVQHWQKHNFPTLKGMLTTGEWRKKRDCNG